MRKYASVGCAPHFGQIIAIRPRRAAPRRAALAKVRAATRDVISQLS